MEGPGTALVRGRKLRDAAADGLALAGMKEDKEEKEPWFLQRQQQLEKPTPPQLQARK